MISSAMEGRETHSHSIRHNNCGAYLCYYGRNLLIPDLCHALCEKGISANIDDYELTRGEEISETALQAIEEARCYIVVFCPKFAFSTRCLDELDKFLDCMKRKKKLVFPIFFQIDPSEVRKRGGNYANAMKEHREKFKNESIKVDKWEVALHEAANLAGWDYDTRSTLSEFSQKIAEGIFKKLDSTPLCNADSLAGQKSYLTEPQRLLGSGSCHNVDTVGKNGIEGIGVKCSIIYKNFLDITQPKPSFASSHRKELEDGEILFTVQPSTSSAYTSKDRGELLGSKMTGMLQYNGMLNVQLSEKIDTRKRKRFSNGAIYSEEEVIFNDEAYGQHMQTGTETTRPRLLECRANQVSIPREVRELNENQYDSAHDASMEAFFASRSAENTTLSAIQDPGSMSLGTTEEMKSAFQTLLKCVSKSFFESSTDRSNIQNIVLSLSADDKISRNMGLFLSRLLSRFTKWCEFYDAADTRLKTTNADLSRFDVLKENFAAAVTESSKAVSAESELSSELRYFQCKKRVLEAELKDVTDKITEFGSSCHTAKARREFFLDKEKRLETEKDNLMAQLPRIRGKQAGAIETLKDIEAEWYKLGEEFKETLIAEFGSCEDIQQVRVSN